MNLMNQIEASIPPRQQIKDLVHGYNVSRAISVATKLRLADILHCAPCSLQQLASQTETQEDALARLLLLLSRNGIFSLDCNGRYQQTSLSEVLRFDHPQSIAKEVLLFAGDETYLAWSRLEDCLRTGETGFQNYFGKSFFEYLSDNHQVAKRFHDGWQEISVQVGKEIAQEFKDLFAQTKTVTDVGGGHGTILAKLLESFSHLSGVLYDLECDGIDAQATFTAYEQAGRYSRIVGSALDVIPQGADIHLLKSVLHNFDDKDCVRILKNCSANLASGGRVLIVERVLGDLDPFQWASVVNMAMLVMTGGRERDLQSFADLYSQAGLSIERTVAMPSGFSVMCLYNKQ